MKFKPWLQHITGQLLIMQGIDGNEEALNYPSLFSGTTSLKGILEYQEKRKPWCFLHQGLSSPEIRMAFSPLYLSPHCLRFY